MPRNTLSKVRYFGRHPLSESFALNRGSAQARGLVSWWPVTDGAGTDTITDLVRGHNFTLASSTASPDWLTDGEFGHVLDFASADSEHAFADHDVIYTGANTTFTVAFWFRYSDPSNVGHIIAKGYGAGGDGGWTVRVASDGKLRAQLKDTGGFDAYNLPTTTAYDDGLWHHCAVVFTTNTSSSSGNTATIYIDGADDSGTEQKFRKYGASTQLVRLGKRESGTPFWDGAIRDIRFYDRAISAEEARLMWEPATRFDLWEPAERRARITSTTNIVALNTLSIVSSAETLTVVRNPLLSALTITSSAETLVVAISVSLNTLTIASSVPKMNTLAPVTVSMNTLTIASSAVKLALSTGVVELQTLTMSVIAVPLIVEVEDEQVIAEAEVILRLVEEGTANVFDLTGCAAYVGGMEYIPRMPDLDFDTTTRINRDGSELSRHQYQNVSESFNLHLWNDGDGMLYTADQLNVFFRKVHERQRRKRGNRIFIEYRPAGRDDLNDFVRSELLAARYAFQDEPLSPQLRGRLLTVTIAWTRRHYWELLNEIESPLENGSGRLLGGATVRNHNDSGSQDDNWLHVSLLHGTLPVAPRLEMQNTTSTGTDRTAAIFIGRNQYSTVSNAEANSFQHILEAENGTKGIDSTAKTDVSSSEASNGQYSSIDWWENTPKEIIQWSLSTDYLNKAGGNWFRIIGSFWSAPFIGGGVSIKVRWLVKVSTSIFYTSEWVSLETTSKLQEMGIVPLPPGNIPATNTFPLTLVLEAQHSEAGKHTMALDFVQVTPLDSWRVLEAPVFGLLQNWTLYDDMEKRLLYQRATGATDGDIGNWVVQSGEPIMLDPNTTQILYFLQRSQTGSASIRRQLKVRMFYRPRSLSPYILDPQNFP